MIHTEPTLNALDLDGRPADQVAEPSSDDLRWARSRLARLLRSRSPRVAAERYEAIVDAACDSVDRTEAMFRAVQASRRANVIRKSEATALLIDLISLRIDWYVAADDTWQTFESSLDPSEEVSDLTHDEVDQLECGVAVEYLRARGEIGLALRLMHRPNYVESAWEEGIESLLEVRPVENAKRIPRRARSDAVAA